MKTPSSYLCNYTLIKTQLLILYSMPTIRWAKILHSWPLMSTLICFIFMIRIIFIWEKCLKYKKKCHALIFYFFFFCTIYTETKLVAAKAQKSLSNGRLWTICRLKSMWVIVFVQAVINSSRLCKCASSQIHLMQLLSYKKKSRQNNIFLSCVLVFNKKEKTNIFPYRRHIAGHKKDRKRQLYD